MDKSIRIKATKGNEKMVVVLAYELGSASIRDRNGYRRETLGEACDELRRLPEQGWSVS
jgi:hypothetical protein